MKEQKWSNEKSDFVKTKKNASLFYIRERKKKQEQRQQEW